MYKVKLEIDFADGSSAEGYPAGWLEEALRHLFETFNDDESLVVVRYQFDGMETPMEVGIGS